MQLRQRRHGRSVIAIVAALTLLIVALVQPVAAAPQPEPRILGGQPADFGEYPFMVAILFEPRQGTDFDKQFCGGSLIASRWVMTAAHCADFIEDPADLAVAVARTHLNSTDGERRAVRSIHIHPDWNPNIISPDVALLELAQPVNSITPIRLAGSGDDRFETAGTILTVIGWGNTDTRPAFSTFPDELREVDVPVVSDAECDFAYSGFVTVETQLCAGEKGVDSCQGDSGGPMFATSGGTEIQIGIVSYGFSCGKQHFPGVYSEVNSPTIRSFITATAGV
jgi:secreted trypsin-like serine protease